MLIYGNILEQLYGRAYGSSAIIVFIGIVFLISSATVLALIVIYGGYFYS